MENLVAGGFLAGVLDVTTTELADDLVGGVLSAGPDRLEAAGAAGVPQVVSLGALDMVNFGPRETVPERFEGRNLYVHNPTITLMRTTPEECRELGRQVGAKLAAATGPTALVAPRRGVSMIAVEGQPFHDPAADQALFGGLSETAAEVEVHELDLDVNDERFAPGDGEPSARDDPGATTSRRWIAMFVPLSDVRREEFDWGVIGWRMVPAKGARHLVVMDVELQPGGGHDFHRHPGQEEMILVKEGHDHPVRRGGVQDPERWRLGPRARRRRPCVFQ